MSLQSLETLAILITPESVRECVAAIRRDPEQLDLITEVTYTNDDPTRQLFRRAMRYAVETPDIEWEPVLRAASVEAAAPGPSRSGGAAPSPGTAPGLSSGEVSDCSAWVL